MKYDNKQVLVTLKDGTIFEGIAIPTTESSSDGIIIVKRKDGYNVGIDKSKIKSVKVMGTVKTKVGKAQKSTLKFKGGPKVGLLATGGTIASRVDYTTGGVTASMSAEEILSAVPEVRNFATLDFKNLFNKLSEDMTPKDWVAMAKATVKLLEKNEGVVIFHGTDTLHYTAAALSFAIDSGKPIVITGAQRSSDRPSSDAFENIMASLRAAQSKVGETMVCFHSATGDGTYDLMRGTRVRKMHTSGRAAFKSINTPVLATITTKGELKPVSKFAKRDNKKATTLDARFEDKVALVKVFPGSDPAILEWYAKERYKGVVLEGTGLGHVPVSPSNEKSWIPIIKKVGKEMAIVMTSQTIYGRTHPHVYTNLRTLSREGVIFVGDMLPETALVKLMWVLGHTNKPTEVTKLMQTNLKGEINSRTIDVDPKQ
ncbi:MAG: Glu-tRNA(Gln) amidotransferase subunit GatD [Candidatus Altiarchaeota archaeon]|nr:Glu-tRNA(Gln) amidotransferase subunit GatD [Candidatus Altiarchaeota archaeon]